MRTKSVLLLLLLPFIAVSQSDFNFFISNSGIDSSTGTSQLAPRKTLAGTADIFNRFGSSNGRVGIGLKSGNIFSESVTVNYPVQVGSYFDASGKDFAILNGSDVFDSGWIQQEGTANTFRQAIKTSGYTGNGGSNIGFYSYVYVIEIDKELEKTAPVTARKILQFAPGIDAVNATPGSFYEAPSDTIPTTVYIHTSDNSSPNLNPKYRYEVAVRSHAVDVYSLPNNKFENLWIRGYGAGTGGIPGGPNTFCNKVIFGPGAAIHHIVLRSGTINKSLFLPPAKNTGNFAVVFYDAEGMGRHNKISNTIFLDIKIPVYTHTSGYGTKHGALELDNVVAFADTTEGGQFVSTADTDTLSLNKIYTDGYTDAYNYVSASYVSIGNSVFKDVKTGVTFGPTQVRATIDNVLIRSKGKDKATGIFTQPSTTLYLTNSVIHLRSASGSFVSGNGATTSHISATGNIFISDVDPSQSVSAATINTDKGAGTSGDIWDKNVYVLVKGNGIVWSVTNPISNNGNSAVQTFDEWKRQSGQDKNSLFFDLRNDPRGLQAIFIDPDHGNYELANTVQGNQVRALRAGMTDPVTCFLQKPTYGEAAGMIQNDKGLSINSCRAACQQATVNVRSSAITDSEGYIHICQDQAQRFTGSGVYKKNDEAYHQSDTGARYLWWFSDETDTSGTNLYTVSHKFKEDGPTNVRLQMVDQNGCSFDSIFKGVRQPLPVVKLGSDTTICRGLDIVLSAYYPGASYLWSTGSSDNSIAVKDKGTVWVQSTFNGCTFRDSLRVTLVDCPCNVQMPNAFSPNGDGLNDVYTPVFGCLPVSYELSVFNRYGELVFTTRNYKTYWNGFSNGKRLPSGVYVYTLKVTSENLQKPTLRSGSILLIP